MDRQCEARSRSQVPSTDLLRVTRTLVCLPLPSLPAPLIAQAAVATLPDRQFHDPHLHLNRDPGRFLFGSDTVAPAFTPAALSM